MRNESWPAILAEQIEKARTAPFSFGGNDCFLFAANIALAMTGMDPAADIRGGYDDERSALKVIARYGSFAGVVSHCFGEAIHPRFAQRGDVVMVLRDGRESLAVCDGARCVGPGVNGLEWAHMSEAICAWKV